MSPLEVHTLRCRMHLRLWASVEWGQQRLDAEVTERRQAQREQIVCLTLSPPVKTAMKGQPPSYHCRRADRRRLPESDLEQPPIRMPCLAKQYNGPGDDLGPHP